MDTTTGREVQRKVTGQRPLARHASVRPQPGDDPRVQLCGQWFGTKFHTVTPSPTVFSAAGPPDRVRNYLLTDDRQTDLSI